ncbi:arginase [Acetoanaerobium pronyense]|uniref:Arginase n=1 Tax=Acetoanaerobium pronyense TaxID=1482736 RepID=A0ABS4KJ98_9FIRM|nr:arginase [Acetoanaerobium pronyense]MBP2027868.1 arginase [Acetoanaerobium pronyense]
MKPSINERLSIIGVAIDLGAGTPGVSLGPAAIRYAGVTDRLESIGYEVKDEGDIVAIKPENPKTEGTNLKNLDEVVRVNTELCDKVSKTMEEGRFPLVLGGDHSIAIGTISGVLRHKKNLGVIWFDAHGDINTDETSPSGNIHGMPVAVSLGLGHEKLTSIGGIENKLDAKNIVFIGSRDLDAGERKVLKEFGITVFTMHEIDRLGMPEVIDRAIKIASEGTDGIHVSFDLDGMDPIYAPGTGTRVPGGLTYRESHLALEMIALTEKVVSAEFVEVNPIIDNMNQTAKSAVALIGSLMGEWLI